MSTSGPTSRAALGAQAEELAAALLAERGFRILQRNWRRPQGEIDLIAEHDGVIVFVEVRSRTGEDYGHPLETVTAHKRSRVVRAARLYLRENAVAANEFRFDVVGVTFPKDGVSPTLVHIEDAFRAP